MKNSDKFALKIFAFLGIIITTIGFWSLQPTHAASLLFVSPSGDDANTCLSALLPCATIDGAISKASSGDIIQVEEGMYSDSLNPDSDFVVTIDRDVTVSGGWNASFTEQTGFSIIDGGKKRGVIKIDADINFYGEYFVIQNGYNYFAGGIQNNGISTLNYFLVQDNDGSGGSNGHAGGIANNGTLHIMNSAIVNNFAYGGGGISNTGQLVIENSTISRNTAHSGGGIEGGYGEADTASLYNVSISNNLAASGAGVSYLYDRLTILNSIIAGNVTDSGTDYGKDCYGGLISLGFSIVGNTEPVDGCWYEEGPGDMPGVDPLLGNLIYFPNNPIPYYPLLANSPAIDAGNPAGCTDYEGEMLQFDQRGALRDGACDIGAYEYIAPGSPEYIYAYTGSHQSANVNSIFSIPLSAVVADAIGSPVEGVTVTFTAPSDGASGVFTSTATISETVISDATGIAELSDLQANSIAGSYQVQAAVPGNNGYISADYDLTNIGFVYLSICTNNYCPDFSDDFSRTSSGWPRINSDSVRADYVDGEYSVQTKQAGYIYMFKAPSCERENYEVSVDARWNGTPGSSYGLLFGLADDFTEYYLYDINTDYQMYRLYRFSNGQFFQVIRPTYSSSIRPGNATNRIEVVHLGEVVTLSINGSRVCDFSGSPILKGNVGILAGSYSDQPFSDARFDDFIFIQRDGFVVPSNSNYPDEPSMNLQTERMVLIPSEELTNWGK